jgi:hypothetical protein
VEALTVLQTTIERKLERIRKILLQVPGDRIALMALGEAAYHKGLRLESLQAYQQVLSGGAVSEAHLAIAHLYCHHGLTHEALAELQPVLDGEPENPEAHLLLQELGESLPLSDGLRELLQAGCGKEEIADTRSKLNIERSMLIREEQELREIVQQDRDELVYQYYLKETRNKVHRLEQLLTGLDSLEQTRRARELESARVLELELTRQRELEQLRAAEALEAEQARIAAEQAEAERVAAELAEVERMAAELAEEERRLVEERIEAERQGIERAELERLAAEQAEAIQLVVSEALVAVEPEDEPSLLTPSAWPTEAVVRVPQDDWSDDLGPTFSVASEVGVGLGDDLSPAPRAVETTEGAFLEIEFPELTSYQPEPLETFDVSNLLTSLEPDLPPEVEPPPVMVESQSPFGHP